MVEILFMQRFHIVCRVALVDIVARQQRSAVIAEESVHYQSLIMICRKVELVLRVISSIDRIIMKMQTKTYS